jgi:hypothetical protein
VEFVGFEDGGVKRPESRIQNPESRIQRSEIRDQRRRLKARGDSGEWRLLFVLE